jgi:hypothetical protein
MVVQSCGAVIIPKPEKTVGVQIPNGQYREYCTQCRDRHLVNTLQMPSDLEELILRLVHADGVGVDDSSTLPAG